MQVQMSFDLRGTAKAAAEQNAHRIRTDLNPIAIFLNFGRWHTNETSSTNSLICLIAELCLESKPPTHFCAYTRSNSRN